MQIKSVREKLLRNMLDSYEKTDFGNWLKFTIHDQIKIVFNDSKCNCDNGIMGIFQPLNRTIYLMDIDSELIFGTLIHELTHVWQYKRLGAIRYFLSLTFKRKKLETEAKNNENLADKWIQNNGYKLK